MSMIPTKPKELSAQAATSLIASVADAAGVDARTIATANTLIDAASKINAGAGMAALADAGTAFLAQARPEVAKALELLKKAQALGEMTPFMINNVFVADHPLCGQTQLEFCSPMPDFVPPAVEPASEPEQAAGVRADPLAQDTRLLRFYSPLPASKTLRIDTLMGSAALSQPFQFHLVLLSCDAGIRFKEVMAKNVTVGIQLADGGEEYINGYVNSFGFARSDGGFAFYEARLVPWFVFLEKRVNSRIFQDQSVLGVIESIFADHKGIANYTFRLSESYEPENYIVQYNESDLHFVSRLMEENGLFYFFEHSANRHIMVICDDSCNSGFCPPHAHHAEVDFNDGHRTQRVDGVTALRASRDFHSSRVTLNTYDFKSPHGNRIVEVNTWSAQGDVPMLETYDGNPAFRYKSKAHGDRQARRRMEVLEWQGKLFHGASDCRAFQAGRTFKLNEHHWFEGGEDGRNDFLLVQVQYTAHNNYLLKGRQQVYSNEFIALRRKIPYRPVREHRQPRMPGPQTATVVGPPGSEIHTDQFGRIKVQFHWDRYGKHDDNSSCWVRVSQPWAGQGWGTISIPRVGQEVILDFLEGDPDRPVCIGRLFNADQTVPYGLPAAAHMMGFRSRSTPGGGGYSEIVIHDAKSKELINIHAQKDMLVTVRNTYSAVVLGPYMATVVKTGYKSVMANKHIDMVSETQHIHLSAATEITLQAGKSSLTLKADGTIEIQGVVVNVVGSSRIDLNT